jgi:HlyD family secretion protein
MTANVSIEVMRTDNVLTIPSSALRFKPEESKQQSAAGQRRTGKSAEQKVHVLKDGKPVAVSVRTGISDDSHVEIISGGLRQGQEVIVEQILPKKKASPAGSGMGPRF